MGSDLIARLAERLPPGRILSGPAHLSAYESDGLTAFAVRPIAVAVPESQEEVIAIVRFRLWLGGAERVFLVARYRWREGL